MKPAPKKTNTKPTATAIRIHFEDQGQDFIWWEVVDGVVVNSWPFQASVWSGCKLLNKTVRLGGFVRYSRKSSEEMCIKYPIVALQIVKLKTGKVLKGVSIAVINK